MAHMEHLLRVQRQNAWYAFTFIPVSYLEEYNVGSEWMLLESAIYDLREDALNELEKLENALKNSKNPIEFVNDFLISEKTRLESNLGLLNLILEIEN